MLITFVRHGETDLNKEHRITGESDVPLNEDGVAQAHETAEEIKGDFDVLYSSTMKRALETAEIINKKLNLPLVTSDLIVERRFGSLTKKTWGEISEIVGYDARSKDTRQEYNYKPFGGETAEDFRKRLFTFVEEVKRSNYKKPLVVCHGGVLRMLHFLHQREITHIPNASAHTFDL